MRTFSINVPNPSAVGADALLRLEPVEEAQLAALGFALPPERLKIRSVRMTTSTASASTLRGCLDALWTIVLAISYWLLRRPLPLRRPTLNVRLDPGSAADVRVSIDAVGATGAAAMHLVDERGGRVVGGVTLLMLEGVTDRPEREIPAEHPCPIVLTEALGWLPAGAEPDSVKFAGAVPTGYDIELLAWITNPTGEALADATAYLEHLGGADAEFEPATWNLGSFGPGVRVPLTWRISPQPDASGTWSASIVVESKGFQPVRIRSAFELGGLGPVAVVTAEERQVEPA